MEGFVGPLGVIGSINNAPVTGGVGHGSSPYREADDSCAAPLIWAPDVGACTCAAAPG